MPFQNYKIIITGAPGTGKTSIVNGLAERGYKCFEEAARSVIKEEQGVSDCLPWDNVIGFSEKVKTLTESYIDESGSFDLVFFDRGLPDTIAYLKVADIDEDLGIRNMMPGINYFPKIFLTPFWEDIYVNDKERKESSEEALRIEASLIATYKDLGFEIVVIEPGSVEERIQFVLDTLKGHDVLA